MDVTKLLGGLLGALLSGLRGHHRPDAETLSAYVDGRLDATERATLEAHLPACAACTTQLAELRALRNTLAAMPHAEAPRSFRLRVADVEAAAVPARPRGVLAFAPTVAAAAMFLLVVVGASDLATRGGNGNDDASSGTGLTAQRIEGDSAAEMADKSLNYSATPIENASGAIAPDDGEPATGGADAATPEAAAGDAAPPALEQTTRSGEDADINATAPAPQPARDDGFAATVNYGEEEDDRTAFRIAEFTLIAVVVVAVLGVGAAWLRRRDAIR